MIVGRYSLRSVGLAVAVAALAVMGPGRVTRVHAAESAPETPGETKEQQDKRMAWWREARFGMFIHWGLYAVPAGQWQGRQIGSGGEWIMHTLQIPGAEYESLAQRFNPVKFNAAQWVQTAKEAGMKYMVITAKHHDGFCLFDSQLTDYDMMDAAPFKRDIMKELADECRRQGIKMCWYYSVMDWHHPDYLPRRPWEKRSAQEASYDRYIDYMKGQLRELLSNYGAIGMLWFDGSWEHSAAQHRAAEVLAMVRSIQPSVVVNNRLGPEFDVDSREQYIPVMGIPGRDWEVCMTMNNTWGFMRHDQNWKSQDALIRMLVDIACKGGNFLLNVGPTGEGVIPPASVERLKGMGRWLKANGQSIYDTQAGPVRVTKWGGTTHKGNKVYVHILRWPEEPSEGIRLPLLGKRIVKSCLLAGGKAELAYGAQEIRVNVAQALRREPDTIVVLELDGPASEIGMRAAPRSGRHIEASSVYESDHRYGPDKAFDGNLKTRWATGSGTLPAWLEVSFGKTCTISGVRIRECESRVQRFELQSKQDGQWKTFHQGERIGEDWRVNFGPVKTGQIRLDILETTAEPTIWEIEVFDNTGKSVMESN